METEDVCTGQTYKAMLSSCPDDDVLKYRQGIVRIFHTFLGPEPEAEKQLFVEVLYDSAKHYTLGNIIPLSFDALEDRIKGDLFVTNEQASCLLKNETLE